MAEETIQRETCVWDECGGCQECPDDCRECSGCDTSCECYTHGNAESPPDEGPWVWIETVQSTGGVL